MNSLQFTAMNTLTLIDLQDSNASSGNSLMSVVVQLSISLGVACAAALLGGFQTDLIRGRTPYSAPSTPPMSASA